MLAVIAMMVVACAAPAPRVAPGASVTGDAPIPATRTLPVTAAAPPVYLFELMARADYAAALRALPQSVTLPAWVWQGGTATPARRVQIEGVTLQLASACKPHAYPLERIALLYDGTRHAMCGLYVTRSDAVALRTGPDDDTHDALHWLGAPDAAQRKVLHEALYAH